MMIVTMRTIAIITIRFRRRQAAFGVASALAVPPPPPPPPQLLPPMLAPIPLNVLHRQHHPVGEHHDRVTRTEPEKRKSQVQKRRMLQV